MEFHAGKVTGISGDSGVGKTTILRMLAGLTKPTNGAIRYDENVWFDGAKKINILPQERRLGFVFQNHQLFPNMTFFENLKYAASHGENVAEKIDHYLSLFGLSEFKNSKPDSLSGGQCKRAVIIAALLRNPKLLLLDEPFADLDDKIAVVIQDEILKYTIENECVTVLVTHEIAEIFKMTSFLYRIQKGGVILQGSPADVFNSNASIGSISLVGVVIEDGLKSESEGELKIMINEQIIEVSNGGESFKIGEKILLNIGADKVDIIRPKTA